MEDFMKLKKQKCCLLSLAFICMFFPVSTIYADIIPQFTIVTEDWEPYNFQKNGVVKGISVDMLVLMLKRAGSTQGRNDINICPWARAYKYIQEEPNTILFTTTRTRKREKMFKWVGPIIETEFLIYALKTRSIKINSFEDLRKYKIGTLRGDVTEDLLIKNAGMKISDFDPVATNIQNIKKLSLGRIDLIVHSKETTITTCRDAGLNPDEFESVFTLDRKSLYYAFHKETPDSVITIFQTAFDEIKKEGKLSEILRKYGK